MTERTQSSLSCENTDRLGMTWYLAPHELKRIYYCQSQLSSLYAELRGYSGLLKKMGKCEMEDGELYGLGITLEKISGRLLMLSDRLNDAITSDCQTK